MLHRYPLLPQGLHLLNILFLFYNNLYVFGKDRPWILKHGCGNLHSFTYKSFSEIWWGGLGCLQRSSSSKRCSVELRSRLCAGHPRSFTPTLAGHVVTCAQGHRHVRKGLVGETMMLQHTDIVCIIMWFKLCGNRFGGGGDTHTWMWWLGVHTLLAGQCRTFSCF